MGLQSLVEQSVALMDAKAMLLVDHHQTQPLKLDRVLQERMGAHQHLQAAVGQIRQKFAAPAQRC